MRVELIEADVDMAFGLVDDALEEFRDGNIDYARAALKDAEKVVKDIETRLSAISSTDGVPFGSLVGELRKSIRAAEAECA
jgi:hypothetical protein